MTTGRINQITIVYREGCGHRRCEQHRRDLKLLDGIHEGCAGRSTFGVRRGRRGSAIRFPALVFPRTSVHRTAPAVGSVIWASQEKDSAPDFSHCGVRWAWLPPVALFQDLPSASHPQNPFFSVEGMSQRRVQAFLVRREA